MSWSGYLVLKWVHVLSSTVLFGTGLGTAFFMFMAHRRGSKTALAEVGLWVVWADWCFTTPSVIVQPVTGVWLAHWAGYPWSSLWLQVSLGLYLLAGLCWLPVVWLQIQMQAMAAQAVQLNTEIPARYWRYARLWTALGVPAFVALVLVFYLMVAKPM